MRVDDFDFELPEGQIAQAPLPERDASRLLVLPRAGGAPEHGAFRSLPERLAEGDLLVVNDARVIPARLRGHKRDTGGRVELLLMEQLDRHTWLAMGRASKGLHPGTALELTGLAAEIVADEGDGVRRVRFEAPAEDLLPLLEAGAGQMPLPPYIHRDTGPAPVDDRERYQTIFADRPGAVAAPTAGLHFTPRVLEALAARGVETARITLHVGPGTFLPVRVDDVDDHVMHQERFEVSEAAAEAVARTRARGGRVVAVGTTSLRTLEAAADGAGGLKPGPGRTDLFVKPGYAFRTVDGLVTNFHLPRSTLLMLVCALGGTERVLAAYREAVARGYRFYSYGDAMLIL